MRIPLPAASPLIRETFIWSVIPACPESSCDARMPDAERKIAFKEILLLCEFTLMLEFLKELCFSNF